MRLESNGRGADGAEAQARRVRAILWAGILGALWVLFHLQGNSVSVDVLGRSAFRWMVTLWKYPDYDFSLGWVIPLVSGYVLWQKRKEFRAAPAEPWWPALAVVVFALLLHVLGVRVQQTRLSLVALILLLWSVPAAVAGRHLARLLVFPCAYLAFCIPFTFLDAVSFKLRLVGAAVSAALLNGIGIATVRNGTALYSQSGGGFALDVADPCSGLKYFMALTALTAAYAYLAQKTLLRKWLLFLCAVPIAVGANILRVTGIGVAARLFGTDVATGLYHDWSGYLVFLAAVLMMLGAQAALNYPYRERMRAWRRA